MKNMKKKTILMLATMVLLLTVTVGSTIAYLVTSSGPVENKFTPAEVKSSVQESFMDNVKKDVAIKNEGNTDAKIRVAIVVTWKDANDANKKTTLAERPALGTDYSMTLDLTQGWSKGEDGYYYWQHSVAPHAQTGVLIKECKQIKQYEDDRVLCVEVIGSAIQADRTWGEGLASVVH